MVDDARAQMDGDLDLEKLMVDKVIATPSALELVEFLKQPCGTVMFHPRGGCDNSAAN